jgi:GntR family transcriptional regulator
MSTRPEPPSRTIANHLRAQITDGSYAPGAQLPSERLLAAEFRTARNTAREALSQLASEGLVNIEHGRGVFVRTPTPLIRLGAARYTSHLRAETGVSPFRAEAAAQGKQARVDVPSIKKVTAPADVAERLSLSDEEAKVVERTNHYFTDDQPVQIGITYIPWTIAGGTVLASKANTGPGSIYGRLAELGHTMTRVREEISARMPRPDEIAVLDVPAGVPVIELLHTGIDQDGQPFEVTRFVMRADRSGLDYQIDITEPA